MNLFNVTAFVLGMLSSPVLAEEVSADVRTKLAKKFAELEKLAAQPNIVKMVSERNKKTPDDLAKMTQDKWKTASILDPAVRGLSKNDCAEALKLAQKADAALAEAFVSGVDGTKVCFISKTSGWSHKGKSKHDDPMAGKKWTGDVEVDSSSGLKQVQIAVPVMIDGKPAGSLVVGYQISKL